MEQISFRKYVLQHNLVSRQQLEEAETALRFSGSEKQTIRRTLAEYLCEMMILTETDVVRIYTEISGAVFADIDAEKTDGEAVRSLPPQICRSQGIFPVRISDQWLLLAMKDPQDLLAIQKAREYSGKRIRPCTAFPSAIDRRITEVYGVEQSHRAIAEMTEDHDGHSMETAAAPDPGAETEDIDSATARYVSSMITMALEQRASDIHIEPGERECVIRIRVDGLLREMQRISRRLHPSVTARIKVMAGMDIAEKRVPQDGRTSVRSGEEETDLRISTLPTVYGEKVVIRLLRKSIGILEKDSLGMDQDNMSKYEKLLSNHSGLILISGATGSGKSTTQYAMLSTLNRKDVNIITLEDPVEYHMNGISQVQINTKSGMTFVKGLKAALRQDPDIICIGEIRDRETAEIAMRAAITGHLVISTIHTSSAVAAFERLLDMGVPGYMIASSLIGVISQRLVRKICPACRVSYEAEAGELAELAAGEDATDEVRLYRGTGCPACAGTGYKGRSGVFEILLMERELRRCIAAGADIETVRDMALRTGYRRLKQVCLDKIFDGVTTSSEAVRVFNTVE
ncbi:MAG: type II/IV secretion system protein [Lachnospiraceae bacterium]|nr:type II/IV secretion system protein [Lachnospiraceae bacterium]